MGNGRRGETSEDTRRRTCSSRWDTENREPCSATSPRVGGGEVHAVGGVNHNSSSRQKRSRNRTTRQPARQRSFHRYDRDPNFAQHTRDVRRNVFRTQYAVCTEAGSDTSTRLLKTPPGRGPEHGIHSNFTRALCSLTDRFSNSITIRMLLLFRL